MTEAEIRADERKRIVQAIQRLTRADYSPSNIWRYYYPSATGDWVDLREVLKVVRGTEGVAPSPVGPVEQVVAGMAALDDGHDPLCVAVIRGKGCTCGFNARIGAPGVREDGRG